MAPRWRILGALTLARASMGFQFQSVASAAPFLAPELGLDKTQLGWLIGLYLLPGVVIALPGGLLGARFGDKRVTLAGLGLMIVGGLWLAVAGSLPEANAARLVSGVGAVGLNVLLAKMVADWFEDRERVLAMSILVNSWPIGIGIALLLLGPLAELRGWHWAISSTAIFATLGFAAVLIAYSAPPKGPSPGVSGTGIGVLTGREWRLLALASLPWVLYNAAYQIVVSFLPFLFLESGLSVARAGALTAANTVLFVLSVQAGGIVLKRARRPDRICYAAIVGWSATLLLLSGESAPMAWIVLGGLLGGLPAGAFVTLPAEVLRAESRGAGMGVFFTVYYVGCAILPSAAGALYDHSGSARATLWMAASLALACFPAQFVFRRALKLTRP